MLILIGAFLVGATIGRPRALDLREALIGFTRSVNPTPAATEDFVLGNGGTKAPPYKGDGLCSKPLEYKGATCDKTER